MLLTVVHKRFVMLMLIGLLAPMSLVKTGP